MPSQTPDIVTTERRVTSAPGRRSGGLGAGPRHALTLTWRSLLKVRNNPEQLLDVVIQPVLFVVLFVFVFGGAVAGDWHTYLRFLLPGLMVQQVLFATMSIGVMLSTDITKGIVDRFRSLPIARSAPLVGAVLGDAARYMISMVVLLAFGGLLGFRFETGLLPALAACALVLAFALALCWIPAFVGLLVKNPQSVSGIGFVVLFPLTIVSNVFAEASTMPGWLRAWVRVNPVSQVVDAARGLMLGGPVAVPLLATAVWGACILAIFVPLTVRAYIRHT
ncbi:ABC transporter permease [Sphaerisporangium fuscum]|uniref:ABC transporter permease n=1 Tax=Sphaerisporangium fuscum TaxID=2835868 RepID=UPI0027E2CF34|nr:ABC transporter permease [Sphaerisporangium fuscum]